MRSRAAVQMRKAQLEQLRNDAQVGDEALELGLAVVGPQDGGGMDRCEDVLCEVGLERPSLAEDRLRGVLVEVAAAAALHRFTQRPEARLLWDERLGRHGGSVPAAAGFDAPTTVETVRSAIVVPGHGAYGPGGQYLISSRCRRLVAEAERLAQRVEPVAVVFSGWSPAAGLSEAEQMRDAWHGPIVELVVERTARITAENAARTLPLLLEREVERAAIVCAPVHLYRVRFFFRRIYGAAGIETDFHLARIVPTPHAVAWELAALALRRRQLRTAQAAKQ
jgi:uncharacterized SAM-binding protein YcdF (DUF218 family)